MVYPQELAPAFFNVGGQRGQEDYEHNMFGSKMYKLREPHTLRWPDTVVTDGLRYFVDDPVALKA